MYIIAFKINHNKWLGNYLIVYSECGILLIGDRVFPLGARYLYLVL